MNFSLSFPTVPASSQSLNIAIRIGTGSPWPVRGRKRTFLQWDFRSWSEEQRPPTWSAGGSSSPEVTVGEGVGNYSHPRDVLFGRFATFKNLPIIFLFLFLPIQKIRKISEFPWSLNIIIECAMLSPHSSWHQLTGPSRPSALVTRPGTAAEFVSPLPPGDNPRMF